MGGLRFEVLKSVGIFYTPHFLSSKKNTYVIDCYRYFYE